MITSFKICLQSWQLKENYMKLSKQWCQVNILTQLQISAFIKKIELWKTNVEANIFAPFPNPQ